MKKISGFLQFLIGFILGITLFAGGAALVGYVIFTRFTSPPQKPVFSEEKPKPSPSLTPVTASPSPSPVDSPASSPSPAPSPEESLPPGAYKAKVIWSEGLSLRSEPSRSSERAGGVAYNDEVVVLEKSADGEWVKIRAGGQEGWVRQANLEKVD